MDPTSSPTAASMWDAHISEIFTVTLILTLFVLVTVFAVVFIAFYCCGRKSLFGTFGGAMICLQDVVTDWLSVVEWYESGDVYWASFMLMSILLGGLISAEFLRRKGKFLERSLSGEIFERSITQEERYDYSRSGIIMRYFVDLLGFSVIRTLPLECQLKEDRENEQSWQVRRSLVLLDRDVTVEEKQLFYYLHIGGLCESMISFGVVSYILISGNITTHYDVQKPSDIIYMAWIFSYLGITYKIWTFDAYEESTETHWWSRWNETLQNLDTILLGWMMTFCLVFPALIWAQWSNQATFYIYPDVLSKNIALSYFLATFILVLILEHRFNWIDQEQRVFGAKGGTVTFVLGTVGTVWLLLTQLYIFLKGEFRTNIGETMCYFWTIGAIIKLSETVLRLVCLAVVKSDDNKVEPRSTFNPESRRVKGLELVGYVE